MLPAPPFVLIEDRVWTGAGGTLFSSAREMHSCRRVEEVPAALAQMARSAADGLHLAGWLAYECGAAFEPALGQVGRSREVGEPLLWFGAFERREALAAADLDRMFAARAPDAAVADLRHGASRAEHTGRIRRALELIAAGDLYQVNLTFPLRFSYAGDPAALYGALRAGQAVGYGGLVATDDAWVLSFSPELFVEVVGGQVTTRPMKGTAPRGADAASDAARLAELRADPKQRAENLMIVDLLRNDLSRVCRPGSVTVTELFTPETYATLHTLTSTVTGELAPAVGGAELLGALFPCGSVVGAPKIRAGQVVAELEDEPRGVYTGAIGALSPGGDLRLNVAIRTVALRDGEGTYGVGGGIVADSDPDSEYDEALLKGRLLADLAADFQLIETFAWTRQGFVGLQRHLARLAASAASLGFACDLAKIRSHLMASAAAWDGARRVRLVLHRDGEHELTAQALEPWDGEPLRLAIAPEPLDAADPFLRHKTSRRAAYERAFSLARGAGADEAVLLNRAGRVADASRASIFVRKRGLLTTPPVEDGALAGVLRQALLESGQAAVGPLTPADLMDGELFVGSSLRGMRPAELVR